MELGRTRKTSHRHQHKFRIELETLELCNVIIQPYRFFTFLFLLNLKSFKINCKGIFVRFVNHVLNVKLYGTRHSKGFAPKSKPHQRRS